MRKTTKKRAAKKKTRKTKKPVRRSSGKGSRLRKAARAAFHYGGED